MKWLTQSKGMLPRPKRTQQVARSSMKGRKRPGLTLPAAATAVQPQEPAEAHPPARPPPAVGSAPWPRCEAKGQPKEKIKKKAKERKQKKGKWEQGKNECMKEGKKEKRKKKGKKE
jgi:hypothetical protein